MVRDTPIEDLFSVLSSVFILVVGLRAHSSSTDLLAYVSRQAGCFPQNGRCNYVAPSPDDVIAGCGGIVATT